MLTEYLCRQAFSMHAVPLQLYYWGCRRMSKLSKNPVFICTHLTAEEEHIKVNHLYRHGYWIWLQIHSR